MGVYKERTKLFFYFEWEITLEQAMKAQKYSTTRFFNLSATWGWAGNATPRPLYLRDRDPVPLVRETRWVPGPFWTEAARTFQPVVSLNTD